MKVLQLVSASVAPSAWTLKREAAALDSPVKPSNGRHSFRFFLLISALLLVPTFSHAAWKVKTLSKGGTYNAIAIDPSGNPHISYLDDSNPADYVLRHASFNGKSWHNEVVDSGDVGWWNSIAVDSLGHIHISYLADKPYASLRYAHFDGTTWSVTTVDGAGGWSTSITVGSDNLPHISYVDSGSNNHLKYARFNGTDWVIETIPGASALWFGETSIAIGISGETNITFSDWDLPRRLYWATNLSGSWDIKKVGDGRQGSLAMDKKGKPHVAFNSEATREILYSSYDGTQWMTQNLTDLAGLGALGIGEAPAVALDSQDRPQITFGFFVYGGNSGVETLIYARFNGVGWEFELLDFKNSGFQNSIALDPWDLPHISYQQDNRNKASLKYANSGIKPPQIVTKSLKKGKSGKKYKAKLNAKDGKKPYQWEVTNGNFPPGLELDPTGVISGIPGEAGEFVFEVKISDILGLSRTETFTLIVQ